MVIVKHYMKLHGHDERKKKSNSMAMVTKYKVRWTWQNKIKLNSHKNTKYKVRWPVKNLILKYENGTWTFQWDSFSTFFFLLFLCLSNYFFLFLWHHSINNYIQIVLLLTIPIENILNTKTLWYHIQAINRLRALKGYFLHNFVEYDSSKLKYRINSFRSPWPFCFYSPMSPNILKLWAWCFDDRRAYSKNVINDWCIY